MYPNEEDRIVVPTTKGMEFITGIQVCLIWQMNFDYKKNYGKKSFFLKIQSINIMYPNEEDMIVMPITKRM